MKYDIGEPKFDVSECIERGITYAAPIKATFRLIVWDVFEDTGTREIKGIKEQDVYLCDIPLMTPNGTFIVNGTERVVVSQMHRSPGVFLITIRVKLIVPASFYTPHALFLTVVHGLILNLTPRIWYISVSTADVKSRSLAC